MGLNAAHFQQTLVYEREADAGTLLEDLDQISHLDDVAEQQQRITELERKLVDRE